MKNKIRDLQLKDLVLMANESNQRVSIQMKDELNLHEDFKVLKSDENKLLLLYKNSIYIYIELRLNENGSVTVKIKKELHAIKKSDLSYLKMLLFKVETSLILNKLNKNKKTFNYKFEKEYKKEGYDSSDFFMMAFVRENKNKTPKIVFKMEYDTFDFKISRERYENIIYILHILDTYKIQLKTYDINYLRKTFPCDFKINFNNFEVATIPIMKRDLLFDIDGFLKKESKDFLELKHIK